MNVSKRNTKIAAIMLVSLTTLLAFQNCGKGLTASGVEDNASESLGEPITKVEYHAGDSFHKDLLPYYPKGQLVTDLKTYGDFTGFKAVAIAPNGQGVARGYSRYASQEEATKNTLEMCQLVSGGIPCGLFAEGDIVKYGENDFLASQKDVLKKGVRDMVPSEIPGFLDYWEPLFAEQYKKEQNPYQAIALGPYGKVIRGWGATQTEATRRAMQMCEGADATPCTLYAENQKVLFNVDAFNFNYEPTTIKFAPSTVVPADIPWLTDATLALPEIKNLPQSYNSGLNPALAISRYGHYSLVLDKNATPEINAAKALSECNRKLNDVDRGCVVYSQGRTIVMTREILLGAKF